MNRAAVILYGHAHLTVTGPDGTVRARAEAANTVLTGGLSLLAQLLAGEAGQPRFAAIVGVSQIPTQADMTIIVSPDGWLPAQVQELKATETQVTMKAIFAPAAADTVIHETGLELTCKLGAETEKTRLYNRAQVKPGLQVRSAEVLTVTWTLTFAPAAS